MTNLESSSPLQDETALRWSALEREREPCIVVSERMELVYLNAAARQLAPGVWFGKRCFEVLPNVDESCALHCPKIRAVTESPDVVYCEETIGTRESDQQGFGVGLIPLGPGGDTPARAILLLRAKDGSDDSVFQGQLLQDAKSLAKRISST
ncbi:MAG: PAS domain-containing protein [Vicinamibacterales bacterium]|nr:PAS domain-containing protein [Vicinamibacterales bacterium]